MRWLVACLLLLLSSPLWGQLPQSGRVYHPLNQRTPPGVAGRWMSQLGRPERRALQPVRIYLPDSGRVAFFNGTAQAAASRPAPAQARVALGHVYRLRISHLADFPGVELYPSIEVLSRLHPPPGEADRFPIPVVLSRQDIEQALAGQLVTKVIYLEQPSLAVARPAGAVLPADTLPAHDNLLAEADRRGRPMLIVRLGGRLPNGGAEKDAFFGPAGPLKVAPQTESESARSEDQRAASRRQP